MNTSTVVLLLVVVVAVVVAKLIKKVREPFRRHDFTTRLVFLVFFSPFDKLKKIYIYVFKTSMATKQKIRSMPSRLPNRNSFLFSYTKINSFKALLLFFFVVAILLFLL